MTGWPGPQSSVQITSYDPSFVGVITVRVSMPGTASCFMRNSGTQKAWMTSLAVRISSTGSFTRSTSSPSVRSSSGYVKLQANWAAVTSIVVYSSGSSGSVSARASATALQTDMATTSTVGTAVHQISSPVWPWIGEPSSMSSAGARNFQPA